MTQLSRKQKYQELRDRLDEETTAAQAQPVKLQRLSRVDSGSHANKPLYPHDTVRVSPTVKEMPTSPVMEDLLGEVKQYNIDNGNRITDDTQINILKQLDSTSETRKRNQHVIPMETDDEDLGSTMKISKPTTQEFERSKVRQTHFSGREGAAGVPASDVATAGAAGEKGEKSGAAVSSFSLQPTGARAGTSHPAANAANAAASSPPHSPMRPPARCTNCFIYKPLLCSGRSAAGTLSAYK